MSKKDKGIDWSVSVAIELKERIEELEKKYKLQANYNNLLEVHMETIKKYEAKSIECQDLKNEIVKDLEAVRICNIFKDRQKWIERVLELIEKWEKK